MHKPTEQSIFHTSRREFLGATAAISALAVAPRGHALPDDARGALPAAFSGLKPLGSRVRPITADEFHGRLPRAQKLMSESSPKYNALFVAPATPLSSFSGIRWGGSERLLAPEIP